MNNQHIYYRFIYNSGELSMLIQDSKEMILECARILSGNKKKYPVAILKIKLKADE